MTNILHQSNKQDWITPPWITDLAREVMGSIMLDPCSSSIANTFVKADTYFSPPADNGLTLPWSGTLWLNPPYGGATRDWVNALIFEIHNARVSQACLLVNAMTDRKWFHRLWLHADAICFLYKRVQFLHANGESGANPTHGSVVAYFGPEYDRFKGAFSPHGHVLCP